MKKYIKPTIQVVEIGHEPIQMLTISKYTKNMDGYAIIYDDEDWDGELD